MAESRSRVPRFLGSAPLLHGSQGNCFANGFIRPPRNDVERGAGHLPLPLSWVDESSIAAPDKRSLGVVARSNVLDYAPYRLLIQTAVFVPHNQVTVPA